MISIAFALFLQFLAFCPTVISAAAPVNSIPVKVVNHAGAPIELWWIDTYKNDGTLIKQTSKPIRNSTDAVINSYDTHQFLVKFLKAGDILFLYDDLLDVVCGWC